MKKNIEKKIYLSKCCQANIELTSGTDNTEYYFCWKCGKQCNVDEVDYLNKEKEEVNER